MLLFSWLHAPVTHRTRRKCTAARTPARRFHPQLEALEGRCVPSTLKVTNTFDSGPGSLRYEIAQAQSNDTLVFDFGSKKANNTAHTITLITGQLVINKNLTIKGPGEFELTIASQQWVDGAFDTHNGSRIFEVDGAGTTVAVSGLTLTNGGGTRLGGGFVSNDPNEGYGGAVLNFGTLTISSFRLGADVTGTGSDAQYGGAIANFGTMTITGCDVNSNHAYGVDEGGGIYNAGTLTVSGGDVSSNFAGYGGGIFNTGTATISGCMLSSNSGGGVYNAGTAGALMVLNSVFSHNTPDNIIGPYTDGGGNTFN